MIIVLNIFRGNFRAITIYPFIIVKSNNLKDDEVLINHEKIHLRQQLEMLFILFYLFYFVEWVIRLFKKGRAYRNISFERESYGNQNNKEYLKNRKPYSWVSYLKN